MNKKHIKLVLLLLVASLILGITFLPNVDKQSNIFDNVTNSFKKIFKTEITTSTPKESKEVEIYKPVIDYENAVISAVEKTAPSVVSIIITKDFPIVQNYQNNFFNNLPPEFRDFFEYPEQDSSNQEKKTEKKEIGGGTGFIVSSDGLVVTNKHVVIDEDAEYMVLTNDGEEYNAEIVSKDPVQDIAILRIKGDNLKSAKLGDSDSLKLGQTAIAIGNALGEFESTVSVGVVSGLFRSITASGISFTERLENVIQTDAAINKGNSGGPLLNLKGEVIGMNTAIAQNAQNIGFAIPVNRIKRDIKSVELTGSIEVPFLGVRYRIITPEFAESQNLSVDYGALVRGTEEGPAVFPDSSADKAGLQAEDIIIELNGKEINLDQTLGHAIQNSTIGGRITLKVIRNGNEIKLNATLEERPEL